MVYGQWYKYLLLGNNLVDLSNDKAVDPSVPKLLVSPGYPNQLEAGTSHLRLVQDKSADYKLDVISADLPDSFCIYKAHDTSIHVDEAVRCNSYRQQFTGTISNTDPLTIHIDRDNSGYHTGVVFNLSCKSRICSYYSIMKLQHALQI